MDLPRNRSLSYNEAQVYLYSSRCLFVFKFGDGNIVVTCFSLAFKDIVGQ